MEVSGQLPSRPSRFTPGCPLGKVGGSQSRSERCGLDENLLLLQGIELRPSRPKAVSVPTEISGCISSSLMQLKNVRYILLPQFPLCVTRRITPTNSPIGKGYRVVISSWKWTHYESQKYRKYDYNTHTVRTQNSDPYSKVITCSQEGKNRYWK
jgi:hypothetical protein